MATGCKKLPRNTKENIRLSKIAYLFSDLKKLRALIYENKEHYQFLAGFKAMSIAQLQQLGVDPYISECLFIFDAVLTPNFLEQFRQTESRRFWE